MNKLFNLLSKLKDAFATKPQAKLLLFSPRSEKINALNVNNKMIDKNLHFPELEIFREISKVMVNHTPNFKNYFLVAGQHILNSTGSLLEWIINELYLPPENIYLIGKTYSSSRNISTVLEKTLKINLQINSRQIALGGFSDSYDTDVTLLWNKLFIRLAKEISENKRIDGILVLDDGGHLFKKIPAELAYITDSKNNPIPLIGIEQTASGINASKNFPHPIIEVATSAAKTLEAPMLAKLTENLLYQFQKSFFNYVPFYHRNNIKLSDLTFGIVGLGNVGAATLNNFKQHGYNKIIVFDYDDRKKNLFKNVYFAQDISELLQRSDIIFGCTGNDFMSTDKKKLTECLNIIEKNDNLYPKIFISLSSKDTEFNALLTHIHQVNRVNHHNKIIKPLNDILYPKSNPKAIIISGGTPFNFIPVHRGLRDYSIPVKEIQLVRGLLLAAILQGHEMITHGYNSISLNAGQYKLDPTWQSFIVQTWLEITGQAKNSMFQDLNWISENSGGILCNYMDIKKGSYRAGNIGAYKDASSKII